MPCEALKKRVRLWVSLSRCKLYLVLFLFFLLRGLSARSSDLFYKGSVDILRVCHVGVGELQGKCYSARFDQEFEKLRVSGALQLTVFTDRLNISTNERTGRDVVLFLKNISKISSPFSVIIQYADGDSSCQVEHGDLQYRLNSCAWWRLFLHGFGFDVLHEPSSTRLVGKLLHVNECGCACDVLKNVSVLQSSAEFVQEHNLTSADIEKVYEPVLNVKGLNAQIHDSCAVVHSSGILSIVSPGLGMLIDAHDAVFRFNEAPTGGNYTEIAGSKTTHRFTFVPPKSDGALAKISPPLIEQFDKGLLLLSVHFHSIAAKLFEYNTSREGGIGVISTETRREASKCVFGTFHEYPDKPISARDGPHLSQGLIGLLLALKSCKRVVLFGKLLHDEEQIASKHAFHYFETLPPDVHLSYSHVHGRSEEDSLIEHLSGLQTISVVPGKVNADTRPDKVDLSQ